MQGRMADNEAEMLLARRARLVAVVLIATMILWVGAQWLGGRLGLAPRFAILLDLAALAGFVWALAVTFQIRRRRNALRRNRGE